MEKLSTKEIRRLVLKNTIRVLRDHRLYYIFRIFVGAKRRNAYNSLNLNSTTRIKAISNKFRDDNPFYTVRGMKDIILVMSNIEKKIVDSKEVDAKDAKLIQRMIMEHTNNLLHFCVERGVKNLGMMEVLGKEIFESSCKNIFGEDFVDEMEYDEPEIPEHLMRGSAIHSREEFLNFLKDMRNGQQFDNEFLNQIFQRDRFERISSSILYNDDEDFIF